MGISGCLKGIVFYLFLGTSMAVYAQYEGAGSPSENTWQSTNPGAGGAFGVVGAGPTGVIIAGGDLAGAYRSLDHGKSWDLIGSFRGLTDTHICGLGFDPVDPSVIYIGAEHGLFRSSDTGLTVTKVISDGYITEIAVPPSDHTLGYAAYHSKYNSTDGQVYKSMNTGLGWAKVSNDLPSGLHILKFLINSENPDTLFLISGKTDYSPGERKAFRSDDGGVHWKQIGSSLGEVKDMAVDPSHRSIMYLSTYPAGGDDFGYLYRSEDAGDTWSEIGHRTGFIWPGAEGNGLIRLIELDYQYPNGSRSGMWATEDTGASWFRYSDIGENWDKGWSRLFHYGSSFNGDINTFGTDMSDPHVLFWITSQWVFGTFDGGLTFQNLYTNEVGEDTWQSRGINDAVLFDIEISPANPDIIYLGYFDLGLFRSMDHGLSWENCNNQVYTGAWKGDGGSSYTIAADPTRENVVWAAMAQDRSSVKKLVRSSQNGQRDSWEVVGSGLPATTSLFGLAVDPYSPESSRTLLVTAERNVYISHDDGYNWSLSLDSGGKCLFTAIDHFNGNLVYAAGAGRCMALCRRW